ATGTAAAVVRRAAILAGPWWRKIPRGRIPTSPRSRPPSPTRPAARRARAPAAARRSRHRRLIWPARSRSSVSPFRASLRRAANAAGQLDERLFAVIDIDHAAVVGDPEAHRGALVPGVIDHDGVVMHHLDGRIDLLDLDRDRHWRARGREVVAHVHGVLARHDPADADGLLPDRA